MYSGSLKLCCFTSRSTWPEFFFFFRENRPKIRAMGACDRHTMSPQLASLTGPWHLPGMTAMFNQPSIFYLLLANRHLCLSLTVVRACSHLMDQPHLFPHWLWLRIYAFPLIRFLFLCQEHSVCVNTSVRMGGSEERLSIARFNWWFVANSRHLSAESRINIQTDSRWIYCLYWSEPFLYKISTFIKTVKKNNLYISFLEIISHVYICAYKMSARWLLSDMFLLKPERQYIANSTCPCHIYLYLNNVFWHVFN